MGNKRHKPEEIVTKLRQVELLVGQGMARVDAHDQRCSLGTSLLKPVIAMRLQARSVFG
jgi:hypothetical protein